MSNEDLNPSSFSSPSRVQRFNDQILNSIDFNTTLTRTSSLNSMASNSVPSKDTSIESSSSTSTTTSGKFIDNSQTTTTSKINQIVSNGLHSRISLGERRRTYDDEIGKSTAIEAGGASSDSESSERRRSPTGKVMTANENLSGIKKRASSAELRNNYTSEEKNYEGESNLVRPSYSSAPNSSLNNSTSRSTLVPVNSNTDTRTNQNQSPSSSPLSATLYSSQPHSSRANTSSRDEANIGASLSAQSPSPGSYQSPNYHPIIPTLGPVIPSMMLSPINTNVDLSLPLPPPPSVYQNISPSISPYSFPPQIPPPTNSYPTLYPLPIHTGFDSSPLTPSTVVPSEELLNLGAISPLRNSNEGDEGVGSADIIYGSDGEPSTDNFGVVVERGAENIAGGIGLTGMETMSNSNEPPFYRIQGDNTGGHYNIIAPPPLQPQNFPIPPYFSPPQHSQVPPYLSQQQHLQQFSNPSYQYHPHSNFSPPYPPPFQLPQGPNDFNNNRQPQQNLGMNNMEMSNSFVPYHPQQQYHSPPNVYSQYSPHSQQTASPQLTFSPQSPYSQFSPNMNQLLPYPHPSAHAMQLHQQQIQALSQQNQSQQQQQNHNQQYQANEPYRYNSPIPPHSQASSSQQQHQQQVFSTQNSNSPYSTPQIYTPPSEGLARGGLAQAKFYEEVYGRDGVYSAQSSMGIKRSGGLGRGLPRPPVHSPHALWVGNVPSDATHTELWQFFTTRPAPSTAPSFVPPNPAPSNRPTVIDYNSTGVESIHLIARSNCAFVNYASEIHLQHSIVVSHGVSLRPQDPRCKDLVCRVRKREDDSKSGVGLQRQGGMHHSYLAHQGQIQFQQQRNQFAPSPAFPMNSFNPNSNPNAPLGSIISGSRNRNSLEGPKTQLSIASTNSSFLGKYFAKRFFILKSLNEEDLDLSVRTGLWATQTHNEQVLDQAFRSCEDGVYLIFGANKTGEWYGYARMTGSISPSALVDKFSPASNTSARLSLHSTSSNNRSRSSSGNLLRTQTIPENAATKFISSETVTKTGNSLMFSPSESRFVEASPLPMTPGGALSTASVRSVPATKAAISALKSSSLPTDVETIAANLHIPDDKRADTLDPKMLDHNESLASEEEKFVLLRQEANGASSLPAQLDDDGVWRKDTLPTAEERNAKLEKMSDDPEQDGSSSSTETRPFKVEWIKVFRLPFHHTRHIKNAFNGGRECKVSRDGTEVDPVAGDQLLEEFWRSEGGIPESFKSATRNTFTSNTSPINRFREMKISATDYQSSGLAISS